MEPDTHHYPMTVFGNHAGTYNQGGVRYFFMRCGSDPKSSASQCLSTHYFHVPIDSITVHASARCPGNFPSYRVDLIAKGLRPPVAYEVVPLDVDGSVTSDRPPE